MKLYILLLAIFGGNCLSGAVERYEAENAIVDENSIQKVADTKASGGYYINMKEGTLSFKVTVGSAGFYTIWTSYSQPSDTNGKIQNLAVNGVSTGQISFPKVDTFVYAKASSKVKLSEGKNTIDIMKSWGWVNIDYIEVTPYVETPFNISKTLVTPNASENARKMYEFLLNNFQKKVISGVMTNTVMQNDGKYTPNTVENQTEVAWIIDAAGKTPALLGLDFMHAAGIEAENEWHKGYTKATVALAEDIFKKGGIPAYCWHWKDPSHKVDAFYSPSSGNTPNTSFDLKKAFTDVSCETPNTSSDEYKGIIRDLDIIAGYLKTLADKGVPIMWRPLHEASGKWFWWGYSGPKACKGLYRLMFDRFTNYHKLNNLIWVWTTDEAGDALDWYPGDQYVDIVGRDYYYYPREANHSSLVASFEKLKEIFGGRKLITLSENGSVPFPDEMKTDGAGWSYFMPWYGDYTMDGWAHDNTAADWKKIMNSDYVLTLDEMPGWQNIKVPVSGNLSNKINNHIVARFANNNLTITYNNAVIINTVELYKLDGSYITSLKPEVKTKGRFEIDATSITQGTYIIKCIETSGNITIHKVAKLCKS
jgi:mannan endo-1,4-beta-mannosidase